MSTVEELIVKATPEGIDSVTDGLESMSEQAEETTDEIENQSSALGDMSEKFEGAMGAIIGGFAIVTGGLLTRVPVLREAASGLVAVLDAVALKISQTLRPVIGPLTNQLFNLASAIHEADGPMGTLIGVVSTLGTVLVSLGSFALGASKALGALGISAGGIIGTIKGIGAAIAGAASSIISLPVVLTAALVGLAAFAAAYLTNWKGIRDKTDKVLGNIFTAIKTRFNEAKEVVSSILGGIGSDAVEWGKTIIQKLITGIEQKAASLKSTITSINLTDSITIGDISDSVGGAIESSAEAIGGTNAMGGSGGYATYLNGQDIDDNQGRYRKDSLTLRGL